MMNERHPIVLWTSFAFFAAALALVVMEGAGIGNDKVSVTEPRVVIVLDPAQVTKVMDVIGCVKDDGL